MKDMNCKCSHLKSEHQKNILSVRSFCKECHCEEYCRVTFPDKGDTGLMIFSLGYIPFLAILGGIIIFYMPLLYTEMTMEGMIMMTQLFVFSTIGLLCLLFFDLFMGDYFSRKKRRNFNNQ